MQTVIIDTEVRNPGACAVGASLPHGSAAHDEDFVDFCWCVMNFSRNEAFLFINKNSQSQKTFQTGRLQET